MDETEEIIKTDFKSYIVEIEIIITTEKGIYTGWIKGIKGTTVQCESLPDVFTELGTQLRILKELEESNAKP